MPATEPLEQGVPVTTFLGHEQQTIKYLSLAHLQLPRCRHRQLNPRPLCIGQLHFSVVLADRPPPSSGKGLDSGVFTLGQLLRQNFVIAALDAAISPSWSQTRALKRDARGGARV